MLHLLTMLILAMILCSSDSMNLIGKVCIGELGVDDFNIKYEVYMFFRTEETRQTCKLQNHLTMSELRAGSTAFQKCVGSSCGSAVPLWAQFCSVF